MTVQTGDRWGPSSLLEASCGGEITARIDDAARRSDGKEGGK